MEKEFIRYKTIFFSIIPPKLFGVCTQSRLRSLTSRQNRNRDKRHLSLDRTHKLNFHCDFTRFKGTGLSRSKDKMCYQNLGGT